MKKIFRNKWVKRVICLVVVMAVAVAGFSFWKNTKKSTQEVQTEATAVVTRRNIINVVTGSGTIEAYETYNIVPTVNGEIVSCDVEEGDWIEEGQVLYMFDTESSDNAISKAQNSVENALLSLETAENNVENLTIKAPTQGVVSDLTLVVGDKANSTVCTITDNTYMIARIPVSTAVVDKINVGDEVSVGLERYMTTVTGTVDRKASGAVAGENGAMVTYVDVVINNAGSISTGTYCSATFHTSEGDFDGAEAATLGYPQEAKANAEQSGDVKVLYVQNGDWVNEGDIIAVLENSTVENQLRTAQMNYSDALANLNDRIKEAEDYVLTSPIAGKVMEKNYKKGETVAGQNSTTLMVIADTTRMKFTINVDELDVSKISVGQEVTFEADALEGESFIGKIETVSLLGTSANGVTYYPVEVVVDEPGNLFPGMNVSAEIIVESAENVIAVPASAVSFFDGSYYVTVVGEVANMSSMSSQRPPTGEIPSNTAGEVPAFGEGSRYPDGEMPTDAKGQMPAFEGGQMPVRGRGPKTDGDEEVEKTMYAEPVRVEVKIGVSDDDYIEIVQGVEAGQIVSYTEESASSSQQMGFGGMPGGGFGGGMPGGGFGGRMPGGGMR